MIKHSRGFGEMESEMKGQMHALLVDCGNENPVVVAVPASSIAGSCWSIARLCWDSDDAVDPR